MHITDTKSKIVAFIQQNQTATNKQLTGHTGLTVVGVSQHLKELVDRGYLTREGKPPNVIYRLGTQQLAVDSFEERKKVLEATPLPTQIKQENLRRWESELKPLPKPTAQRRAYPKAAKTITPKDTALKRSNTITLQPTTSIRTDIITLKPVAPERINTIKHMGMAPADGSVIVSQSTESTEANTVTHKATEATAPVEASVIVLNPVAPTEINTITPQPLAGDTIIPKDIVPVKNNTITPQVTEPVGDSIIVSKSSVPGSGNTVIPKAAAPDILSPLEYWSARLKVDPQLVERCHHGIYFWFFSFGRRVYNEPLGLGAKIVDSFIWVLALGLVWIWGIFTTRQGKLHLPRVGIALFILAFLVVGIVVWRSHRVEQTGEFLNVSGSSFKEELTQTKGQLVDVQNQLAQTKQQLDIETQHVVSLQKDNDDLNQRVLKLMDENSNQRGEIRSLKDQLEKAKHSVGQKVVDRIFHMF